MKNFISIPKPCNENWDAMTPQEQGRHCDKCQLVVTDFTKMSDQEIIHFFNKKEENSCIRIQANRLHGKPTLTDKLRRFIYALAIIFLPYLPLKSFGQNIDTTTIENVKGYQGLEGTLSNKKGEKIPFATVSVSEAGIIKGRTKTDMNGFYKIELLPVGVYTVEIFSVGYEELILNKIRIQQNQTTILRSSFMKQKSILLEKLVIKIDKYDEVIMGGGGMVMGKNISENDKGRRMIRIDPFNPNRQRISGDEIREMYGGN